jgi:hypothetical protein
MTDPPKAFSSNGLEVDGEASPMFDREADDGEFQNAREMSAIAEA